MTDALKAAARAGDPKALEALMNKSFGSKGITVRVTNSGSSLLRVLLRGNTAPDKGLLSLTRKGVDSINPAGFDKVIVTARAIGKGDAWSEQWELPGGSAGEISPLAKGDSPQNADSIANKKKPQWYFHPAVIIGGAIGALVLLGGLGPLVGEVKQLLEAVVETDAEATVAEAVEAPPEVTDYLAQGLNQGYEAAVAAQDAADNQWDKVSQKWASAMMSLSLVPADSPDYATAQAKITEYTANREVASARYNAHLAEVKARQAPTTSPTPTPKSTVWQLSPGWTQFVSEEGKAMAYISREPIVCRDGSGYCFEFNMMAQEGCPNGLYIEGQLIDPNTKAVIGMGNDLLPRLLPGQVGLISINTRGPASLGDTIVKCY